MFEALCIISPAFSQTLVCIQYTLWLFTPLVSSMEVAHVSLSPPMVAQAYRYTAASVAKLAPGTQSGNFLVTLS